MKKNKSIFSSSKNNAIYRINVLAKNIQGQKLDRSRWHVWTESAGMNKAITTQIIFNIILHLLSLPLLEFQKKRKVKKVEAENLGN